MTQKQVDLYKQANMEDGSKKRKAEEISEGGLEVDDDGNHWLVQEDSIVFKQLKCPHCGGGYDHLLCTGELDRGELCPRCGYNVFITSASLSKAGIEGPQCKVAIKRDKERL